jgi:DNA-binding transcriptional regulator YiaG
MPDVSSVLKTEITRVARKAMKSELDTLRRSCAGYRKDIAELKRVVSALQRGQKSARVGAAKQQTPSEAEDADESGSRVRFSAKGLKTLRTKLGLSAAELGRLAGTSGQSVYNWEQGKNVPRQQQAQKLAALRTLGKREAKARLEALAEQ